VAFSWRWSGGIVKMHYTPIRLGAKDRRLDFRTYEEGKGEDRMKKSRTNEAQRCRKATSRSYRIALSRRHPISGGGGENPRQMEEISARC